MNPSQWNGSGTALRQNGAKGIVFSPPTFPRALPLPPPYTLLFSTLRPLQAERRVVI